MELDDFLKQLLAGQERIAVALEKIAANGGGGHVAAPIEASVTVAASDEDKVAAAKAKADADAKAKADADAKAKADADAKAKADADAKAKEEAAAGPTYTIDEVRAALKEYRAIEGAPAMLEVIKTHGGKDTLGDVDPSKFAAIMEAVGAAK